MAKFTIDLDPVTHITAGAIGQPGQRIFYVQARRGSRRVSLLCEKQQVGALAAAIDQLLEELAEKNPRLATSDDLLMTDMTLDEPLEPEFRIGSMGLSYEAERDVVVLIAQGISEEDDEDAPTARFAATRPQMRAMSIYATQVVLAGRPICGNCGRPIDPSGHFCPHRNGHAPITVQ
jgi:uncharacterized repeat protein (TIGR03847 family)